MNNTEVSVIMPAYNAENFIAESIESVLQQTYTNWELLIVDDGSTDNTKEIVERFCNKDSRVKYFYQQNGKQGKARNLALAHAAGKYIAFLDADDVWLSRKLEIQLNQLTQKKTDLVFSECNTFTDAASNPSEVMNTGKGYFSGIEGLKSFLEINKIVPSSVLVKTEALNKVNRFTEKSSIQNAEDYHLWLKLLMNGNIFYGSELVLAYYRIHAASASYADKLSVTKTLEVLEDLKHNYNPYKKVLNAYHKRWFIKYHYSTSAWTNNDYKQLIKKNCRYINRSAYNFFFQTIYAVFGLRATRKLINKIVNGY